MVHAHNMNRTMKNRYRVFRRGWGTYYCEALVTKKQTTLKTRDKDEALRLVAAKNETEDVPAFSLHLARVYWKAGDPAAAQRIWQHVMDEIPKLKKGETKVRWLTANKDKAMDSIRELPRNGEPLCNMSDEWLRCDQWMRPHARAGLSSSPAADEVYTPSPGRSEGWRSQLGVAVRTAPRAKPLCQP